jgi:hypothetical protein
MTNCEKYLQLREYALKFAYENDEEQYQQKANEAKKFREQNFTREDWEQLVAQTKGPAKYRYAKMMQGKYSE